MDTPNEMSFGHILSFYYITFAHATDGDLSPEEIVEIAVIVSGWSGLDPEECALVVKEALVWYASSVSNPEEVAAVIASTTLTIKEALDEDGCKLVIEDLVNIAKADGHFDDAEKKYVKMIAGLLGIDEGWVANVTNN